MPYLDDWLIQHLDRQVLLCHQSQLLKSLDLVGFKLNEEKSELDLVQDIEFLGIRLCLDQGRVTPRIQGSGDSNTSLQNILTTSSVVYTSVPVHGITQLGFRSHPTGSSAPEAITMTFSCSGSVRPLYT